MGILSRFDLPHPGSQLTYEVRSSHSESPGDGHRDLASAMKPSACTLTLVAPLAAAIDLATLQRSLPACSLECLAKGVAVHGCGLAQFTCQCARLEPIIRTVAPCLVKMGCSLENMTGELGRVLPCSVTAP